MSDQTYHTWMKIHTGILDAKHREAMGIRIWLFMYLIDRADWTTGIVDGFTDQQAAKDLDMSRSTLRNWRRELQEAGYITSRQGLHCQRIEIHKWRNPRQVPDQVMATESDHHEAAGGGCQKMITIPNSDTISLQQSDHHLSISDKDTHVKDKDSLADSTPEGAMTTIKLEPKPRQKNDIFDAVAEVAFSTPSDSPGIKAIRGKVGPVAAVVKGLGCTAQEYRDICALWLKKNRGLTLPCGTASTTKMINEYRAAATKRRTLDTEAETSRSVEFDPEAVMPLTPRIIRDAQGNYAGEPA